MADERPDRIEKREPTTCRICGASVPADAPAHPFCSERCRMVDLGRWFSGSYSISRPMDEQDEDADS